MRRRVVFAVTLNQAIADAVEGLREGDEARSRTIERLIRSCIVRDIGESGLKTMAAKGLAIRTSSSNGQVGNIPHQDGSDAKSEASVTP